MLFYCCCCIPCACLITPYYYYYYLYYHYHPHLTTLSSLSLCLIILVANPFPCLLWASISPVLLVALLPSHRQSPPTMINNSILPRKSRGRTTPSPRPQNPRRLLPQNITSNIVLLPGAPPGSAPRLLRLWMALPPRSIPKGSTMILLSRSSISCRTRGIARTW